MSATCSRCGSKASCSCQLKNGMCGACYAAVQAEKNKTK